MYRVWYSTESHADYIIHHTSLSVKQVKKHKICESDANNGRNFHAMPDHIKQILYLDAPDIIVEYNSEPIFSMEISTEAGTGHNVFQRFARLAASVENNVPSFYVYPEAAIIKRRGSSPKWDKINPLIFKALEATMAIYNIPSLFFYFPSDFRRHANPENAPHKTSKGLKFETNYHYAGCPDSRDKNMKDMFKAINEIINVSERRGLIEGRNSLISNLVIRENRTWMNSEYASNSGNMQMSPLSATTTIDTSALLKYLSCYEGQKYQIGELLKSRKKTVIYKVDAKFRGDPYPGALAAIDYLLCRQGKTFEDRKHNLVLLWGELTEDIPNKTIKVTGKSNIRDFINDVRSSESKNLLTRKKYADIQNYEIPRYYMQVRYGSTFSKAKHIRVYSYFADAIIFPNGALWRDG